MSTTLNHLVLSRAQLAEASVHADAGSATLARTHLQFAADHALLALAEIGAAPDVERREDDVDFEDVHALIDAYLAHPESRAPRAAPVKMPLYGGPRGAMGARGAEAAERGLRRAATAIRSALRR